MKITLSLCSVALFCIGSALSCVQAAELGHPLKPMLWTIEGKQLKSPSYLFGTLHLGSPEISLMHPTVEKAFTSADVLYTEIPSDMEFHNLKLIERKDGKKLPDAIGKDLCSRLGLELKELNPTFDVTPFQTLKTWSVAVNLIRLRDFKRGPDGLDLMVYFRSTRQNKGKFYLESGLLRLLDQLTEEQQLIVLEETFSQMKEDRESGADTAATLISEYKEGRGENIQSSMGEFLKRMGEGAHKELAVRLKTALIADVDTMIADAADKALTAAPDKIHFFTTGTDRITGKLGIIGNLTEKGYRITRIED